MGARRPGAAKELIDEAARTTPPTPARLLDAFLTVYWFAMDQPEAAIEPSKALALEDHSRRRGRDRLGARPDSADAGRAAEAVAAAEAGYAVATRSLDAPHMRFNIADAEVSALLLAGRIGDALEWPSATRQQAADLPGAAQLLGAAVAGRAALGAGDLHGACLLLDRRPKGCRRRHSIGWGYRYRVPHVTALAMRGSTREAAAALAALDEVRRRFRALDYERSLARAWVAAGQGAVSEAIAMALSAAEKARDAGRFAAEVLCLQTATQFGDSLRAGPGCANSKSIVEGPARRPRGPVRRRAARRRCRRIGLGIRGIRAHG